MWFKKKKKTTTTTKYLAIDIYKRPNLDINQCLVTEIIAFDCCHKWLFIIIVYLGNDSYNSQQFTFTAIHYHVEP